MTDKPKQITREQLEEDARPFGGYCTDLAREALMLMDERDEARRWERHYKKQVDAQNKTISTLRRERDEALEYSDMLEFVIEVYEHRVVSAKNAFQRAASSRARLRRENDALRELEMWVRYSSVAGLPKRIVGALDALDALDAKGGGGGSTVAGDRIAGQQNPSPPPLINTDAKMILLVLCSMSRVLRLFIWRLVFERVDSTTVEDALRKNERLTNGIEDKITIGE